jgi:hypothetical protein
MFSHLFQESEVISVWTYFCDFYFIDQCVYANTMVLLLLWLCSQVVWQLALLFLLRTALVMLHLMWFHMNLGIFFYSCEDQIPVEFDGYHLVCKIILVVFTFEIFILWSKNKECFCIFNCFLQFPFSMFYSFIIVEVFYLLG